MNFNIFYSWQSDTDNKLNKYFIQDSIEKAIKNLSKDNSITLELSLDRDTKNKPGTPPIVETIFSKIEKCAIFLCDLTIINDIEKDKATPNPNVLIELGYAIAAIGYSRIICIMNTAYGDPEQNIEILPFNIRHLRWPIRYYIKDSANKEPAKKSLVNQLEEAIKVFIKNNSIDELNNSADARFARNFNHALIESLSCFATFLSTHKEVKISGNNPIKIFKQDFPNKPTTSYPDPEVIEPIMKIIAELSFLSKSNMSTTNNKPLPWTHAFIYHLNKTHEECEKLLNRSANRDDKLVRIIEEVNNRAKGLAFIFNTSSLTEVNHHWRQKLHEDYLDFIRYYLLCMLKAKRIVREFNVYEF
jgi:hypothetical protein